MPGRTGRGYGEVDGMGAHRFRTRAVVAALAVAGMVAGAGPPAAATSSPTGPNRQAASVGSAQPPAQSNIIAAALYSLTDPTIAPPGANNWNCRPSAAHPYPVLLSNGTTENAYENWAGMAPALAAAAIACSR
jgi:hypothetical protein